MTKQASARVAIGTIAIAMLLMMVIVSSGCRRTLGPEPVNKTPKQILQQVRAHIKQAARDVQDVYDRKLITKQRYEALQDRVEDAAKAYNKLKAHCDLWNEINETYRSETMRILLFVTEAIKGVT